MKVLIFEHALKVSGHRLVYAGQVAAALTGHEVQVALPEVLQGEPSLEEHFSTAAIRFYPAAQPWNFFQYARQSLSCLQRLVRDWRPDHVLVPTADGLATWGGLRQCLGGAGLGSIPVDICLMTGRRPAADLGVTARFKNGLKWWLLQRGPWKHILLMDPRSWSELPPRDRWVLAPDPVPPRPATGREEARAALQLPAAGRLIVSLGNQDRRKGVDRLIRGFLQAGLPAEDRLVLIGRFSPDVRSLLDELAGRSNAERILARDQFVSNAEFSQALLAADLVATPYRDTSRPSGVVSRCLAWGIPIAAPAAGWLGWALDTMEAGYALDVADDASLGRSLTAALDRASQFIPGSRCRAFAQFNSQANYQALWQALIETPQDLPPPPDFLRHV